MTSAECFYLSMSSSARSSDTQLCWASSLFRIVYPQPLAQTLLLYSHTHRWASRERRDTWTGQPERLQRNIKQQRKKKIWHKANVHAQRKIVEKASNQQGWSIRMALVQMFLAGWQMRICQNCKNDLIVLLASVRMGWKLQNNNVFSCMPTFFNKSVWIYDCLCVFCLIILYVQLLLPIVFVKEM